MAEQANKASKMIWVTFRKEGLHKYPAALDDPKLATGDWDDVSFLGYVHRHIFHFKVAIEVFHDDRDIEFIQFKRWMEKMYAEGTMKLDFKSKIFLTLLEKTLFFDLLSPLALPKFKI